MQKYVLGIDQSTQGTKAILFDENGDLVARSDKSHKQIIQGDWISHNLNEIYEAMLKAISNLFKDSEIKPSQVVCAGISNQRETVGIWNTNGEPLNNAIVWQCGRAESICQKVKAEGMENIIYEHTGLHLSPYFSAAKLVWLLENTQSAQRALQNESLRMGTVDTYLIYRLSKGKVYVTDYSNASRTQLLNLKTLEWDSEICSAFNIPVSVLPTLKDSDSLMCESDFEGIFPQKIPVHSAMGDSHAALYGQNCVEPGMCKSTFGTGSSIMLNTGDKIIDSKYRLSRSVGWKNKSGVYYVLEANINYTGSIISWLIKDIGLLKNIDESHTLPQQSSSTDRTMLIPAFSGLGAPYWNSKLKAVFLGMSRETGRAEMVRASVDSIAYQITDVLEMLRKDSGFKIKSLRVDGGPTENLYLMQLLGMLSNTQILRPNVAELSALGAAYMAGQAYGIYNDKIFESVKYEDIYQINDLEFSDNDLEDNLAKRRYQEWRKSIRAMCDMVDNNDLSF